MLDIDPRQNRISLGMKQLEPNPFASLKEKYPPGTVVKGVVRNIADFGIFVEIEEGIDGLVHVSDLSWTQRVKHPSELYQKGDEVESVVLNIDFDGEKPKVSLGIKQLVPDPWDRIPYDYPVGKIVEAKVHQGARLRRVRGDREGRRGPHPRLGVLRRARRGPEDVRQAGPDAEGRDHRRRHGRAKDRPVVPRRHPRRGAGGRAGLLGRRADRDAGRRHARQAGGADRQDRARRTKPETRPDEARKAEGRSDRRSD